MSDLNRSAAAPEYEKVVYPEPCKEGTPSKKKLWARLHEMARTFAQCASSAAMGHATRLIEFGLLVNGDLFEKHFLPQGISVVCMGKFVGLGESGLAFEHSFKLPLSLWRRKDSMEWFVGSVNALHKDTRSLFTVSMPGKGRTQTELFTVEFSYEKKRGRYERIPGVGAYKHEGSSMAEVVAQFSTRVISPADWIYYRVDGRVF